MSLMIPFKYNSMKLSVGDNGMNVLLSPMSVKPLELKKVNLSRVDNNVFGFTLSFQSVLSAYSFAGNQTRDLTACLGGCAEGVAEPLKLAMSSDLIEWVYPDCVFPSFVDNYRNIVDVFNPKIHNEMDINWYSDLSSDRWASFYNTINLVYGDCIRWWYWSASDIFCEVSIQGKNEEDIYTVCFYGRCDGSIYTQVGVWSSKMSTFCYPCDWIVMPYSEWVDYPILRAELRPRFAYNSVEVYKARDKLLDLENPDVSEFNEDYLEYAQRIRDNLLFNYALPMGMTGDIAASIADNVDDNIIFTARNAIYRGVKSIDLFPRYLILRGLEKSFKSW